MRRCVALLWLARALVTALTRPAQTDVVKLDRRRLLHVLVLVPLPVAAKPGDFANLALPSQSEADAFMGSRADTFGDASRENSLYKKAQSASSSTEAISKKRQALETCATRLKTKLAPCVGDKVQFPKILDVLNVEAFAFKTALSEFTKAAQGGKVCLVDVSQRGPTMPKGFDPDDCPLQLIQSAILQDINDLAQGAKVRSAPASQAAYGALSRDVDAFFKFKI